MAITLNCRCGQKLSVPESAVGKRGKCSKCGATFVIPAPKAAAMPAAAAKPPTEANTMPKRKRVLKGVGIFLAFVVTWAAFELFLFDHTIDASPETTHWTQPLGDDGLPDFRRILLDSQRDGVTPQNNGAIQLWQAMWPLDFASDIEAKAALLAELQMPEPKREGLSSHADLSTITLSEPYTAEQFPHLAEWVIENNEFFELLVEASNKPKFYSPSPTILTQPDTLLLQMSLQHVQLIRGAVIGLIARAMLHIGEGRYEPAWRDISACYKLADKLDEEYAISVQVLAYIGCRTSANNALLQLLSEPDVPTELLKEISKETSARPRIAGMTRSFDKGERMIVIDAIIKVAAGKASLSDLAGSRRKVSPMGMKRRLYNWDRILRRHNEGYDAIFKFQSQPTLDERRAVSAEVQHALSLFDFERWEFNSSRKKAASIFVRSIRSDLMADRFAALLMPAVAATKDLEDRANNQQDLMTLATALAIYRASAGHYPESLDALSPDIIAHLPVDLIHRQPFVYRQQRDGYLLYSLGPNQTDEGGSDDRRSFQGYPIPSDSNSSADQLLKAVYQSLELEAPAGMSIRDLRSRIPKAADDWAIRMPPLRSQRLIMEAPAPTNN